MKKLIGVIVILFLLLAFKAGTAKAGGWAVLTLSSWPGEVTAGEPFTIEYALRQHGTHLVESDPSWLNPTITAVHADTGQSVEFEVNPMRKTGYYEAEILLPEPGIWNWSIDAFGVFKMPPLTVLEATAVAQNAASSPTQLDGSWFANSGNCHNCHRSVYDGGGIVCLV